ncbi:hypothetical protein BH18ACI2_BH18ACI2_18880 [soil metagenome]
MNRKITKRIARLFEIVDYVLLIPGSLGMVILAFALIGGVFSGITNFRFHDFIEALITFIILIFSVFGCFLLWCFRRYARDDIVFNPEAMWLLTIIYNFIFVAYMLYGIVYEGRETGPLVVLCAWPVCAITLSGVALYYEQRNKRLNA